MTETPKTTTHPDARELKAYLLGWVDEDHLSRIQQHVETCDPCEETLLRLERESDTLIESIRAGGNTDDADSVMQSVMGRIRSWTASAGSEMPPGTPRSEYDTQLPERIGPYRLIRALASGGMGHVYLARHETLGREVAIKVLRQTGMPLHTAASNAQRDPHSERFQREIRTAGGLQHPAIVSATDAGTAVVDGQPAPVHYLAMEYIDGVDLSRLCKALGPLSIADACRVAHDIAIGLDYAHRQGVVHRDLKPSNVMLGTGGDVKILDFGLARSRQWDHESAELTTVGQLMGTLDYMSPEQAERPESVDFRGDLYSLGATLFRMLCGRPPLAASPDLSPLAKLKLLSEQSAPRADILRPDLPGELVDMLERLLARDPADRPASAAHVAGTLAEFAAGADLINSVRFAQRQAPSPTRSLSFAATPPATSDRGFGRRWARWLAAAAALPLLIFGVVWVVLETNTGKLVIESEIAGVSVELLQDGKAVDAMQIQRGENETTLKAGRYQVRLESPIDNVQIEGSSTLIRRGETQIASIRRVPSNPLKTTGVARKETQLGDGLADEDLGGQTIPTFDGKPLAHWLAIFNNERQPERIRDAFVALTSLMDRDTVERIIAATDDVFDRTSAYYFTRDGGTHFGHLQEFFARVEKLVGVEAVNRVIKKNLDDDSYAAAFLSNDKLRDPSTKRLLIDHLKSLETHLSLPATNFLARTIADDDANGDAASFVLTDAIESRFATYKDLRSCITYSPAESSMLRTKRLLRPLIALMTRDELTAGEQANLPLMVQWLVKMNPNDVSWLRKFERAEVYDSLRKHFAVLTSFDWSKSMTKLVWLDDYCALAGPSSVSLPLAWEVTEFRYLDERCRDQTARTIPIIEWLEMLALLGMDRDAGIQERIKLVRQRTQPGSTLFFDWLCPEGEGASAFFELRARSVRIDYLNSKVVCPTQIASPTDLGHFIEYLIHERATFMSKE
ncbi:MAG: protein kinase [Planctomycetota bacterium]